MITPNIAMFAHLDADEGASTTAQEALLFASALLASGVRLVVDAPPPVLLPILLAARSFAAQPTLEVVDRGVPPIRLIRRIEDPFLEAGLDQRITIGDEEDAPPVSLIEQAASLGYVDLSWTSGEGLSYAAMLREGDVCAVVAMGWSWTMNEIVSAAEAVREDRGIPLLFAGSQSDRFKERLPWKSLAGYVDAPATDIQPLRLEDEEPADGELFSEEYWIAWERARGQASLVMNAEALTRRLLG